jgi:hypothetical protein
MGNDNHKRPEIKTHPTEIQAFNIRRFGEAVTYKKKAREGPF